MYGNIIVILSYDIVVYPRTQAALEDEEVLEEGSRPIGGEPDQSRGDVTVDLGDDVPSWCARYYLKKYVSSHYCTSQATYRCREQGQRRDERREAAASSRTRTDTHQLEALASCGSSPTSLRTGGIPSRVSGAMAEFEKGFRSHAVSGRELY